MTKQLNLFTHGLPLFGDWEDTSLEQVLSDFRAPSDALDGADLVAAEYTYESYSGSAFVLFERDGELFEVHGNHCSCYGLEDQWEPEPVSVAELRHRYRGRMGETTGFNGAVAEYLA